MPANAAQTWSLEVVKGSQPGRAYGLRPGPVVLGNGVHAPDGLNLGEQEGSSPRRMAARQALLEVLAGEVTLRDLQSPGGTFVNRERLAAGEARRLAVGDVIQLAGVQLRLRAVEARVASGVTPPPLLDDEPAGAGAETFAYTLKDGTICRGWDDFLRVASQRWGGLREELESGRLEVFLKHLGRPDLVPDRGRAGETADQRLDAWLRRLPTSRPVSSELDVYPHMLRVAVSAADGEVEKSLRVRNVGDGLLRVRARVEPAGHGGPRLDPAVVGRELEIVEQEELRIWVRTRKEPGVGAGSVVLEGNGGTKRVEVRYEALTDSGIDAQGALGRAEGSRPGEWLAGVPLVKRLVGGGLMMAGARVLLAAGGWLIAAPGSLAPGLAGPAVLGGILGGVAVVMGMIRQGHRGEEVFGGVAGAIAGVMGAALALALCRAVEPALGLDPGRGGVVAVLLWGLAGLGLAGASMIYQPVRTGGEGAS